MREYLRVIVLLILFATGQDVTLAQDCPASLPTRLSAVLSSNVNPGYALDLRTAPENGDVIATLPEGSRFQIVGQAGCGAQNGVRWWQIEWNGQTGFIPESDLNNVWIEQPPAMFLMPGADVDEPTATPIRPALTPTTGIIFNDLRSELAKTVMSSP